MRRQEITFIKTGIALIVCLNSYTFAPLIFIKINKIIIFN